MLVGGGGVEEEGFPLVLEFGGFVALEGELGLELS